LLGFIAIGLEVTMVWQSKFTLSYRFEVLPLTQCYSIYTYSQGVMQRLVFSST